MRPLVMQVLSQLTHERFTSGSHIAAHLGVSRSAVSEALKEADGAGIRVFSLTRKGYRLAAPFERLSPETLHRLLGPAARRLDVEVVETIESTNTTLMQRANLGAPSGASLAAEMQTAGRGRRGRSWQGVLGGSLTFSLLWRFDRGAAQLAGLSLVVGVAIVRALRKSFAANVEPALQVTSSANDIALKWPNDIVWRGRKLGGVLIETQGDVLGPTAVVIGIGLNTRMATETKSAIDQPVADWSDVVGSEMSRNALLAGILGELVTVLDAFELHRFGGFRDEWIAMHALQGAVVSVTQADKTVFEATVCGVADDGALLVRRGKETLTLTSADVRVRAEAAGKRVAQR